MSRTARCQGCGGRTCAAGGICRTCKFTHRRAYRRIKAEGLILDQAGGAWWVWDPKGAVLVIGRPTRFAAQLALINDPVEGDA